MSFITGLFGDGKSAVDSIVELGNRFNERFKDFSFQEAITCIEEIHASAFYRPSAKNTPTEMYKKVERFIIENQDLIAIAHRAKTAEEGNEYMNGTQIIERISGATLTAVDALAMLNLKTLNQNRECLAAAANLEKTSTANAAKSPKTSALDASKKSADISEIMDQLWFG